MYKDVSATNPSTSAESKASPPIFPSPTSAFSPFLKRVPTAAISADPATENKTAPLPVLDASETGLLAVIQNCKNRHETVQNLKTMPSEIQASYLKTTNSHGYTPLTLALDQKDEAMALILINLLKNLDENDQIAILKKTTNSIKNNHSLSGGDTALTLAYRNRFFVIAKELVHLSKKLAKFEARQMANTAVLKTRKSGKSRLKSFYKLMKLSAKVKDDSKNFTNLLANFVHAWGMPAKIITQVDTQVTNIDNVIQLAHDYNSACAETEEEFDKVMDAIKTSPDDLSKITQQLEESTGLLATIQMPELINTTETPTKNTYALCLGAYLVPTAHDGHNALTLAIAANNEANAIKFFHQVKKLTVADKTAILTTRIKTSGNTPLILAITQGFFKLALEIAQCMISMQTQIPSFLSILYAENKNGWTALSALEHMQTDKNITAEIKGDIQKVIDALMRPLLAGQEQQDSSIFHEKITLSLVEDEKSDNNKHSEIDGTRGFTGEEECEGDNEETQDPDAKEDAPNAKSNIPRFGSR